MHTGHADEIGVARGQRAEAHESEDGGDVGGFGEFAQFRRGARREDAAAGIDERPFGFESELRGAAYLSGVTFGEDFVAGQVDGGDRSVVALGLKDVLRDID